MTQIGEALVPMAGQPMGYVESFTLDTDVDLGEFGTQQVIRKWDESDADLRIRLLKRMASRRL